MSIRGEQTEAPKQMLSSEIQGLVNGAGAVQDVTTPVNTAYDNRDSSGKGWLLGQWWYEGTLPATPTADSSIEIYNLYAFDGTNYPTCVTGTTPSVDNNALRIVLDVKGLSGFQRIPFDGVPLLPYLLKNFVINKTGVTLPNDSKIWFSPSGEK